MPTRANRGQAKAAPHRKKPTTPQADAEPMKARVSEATPVIEPMGADVVPEGASRVVMSSQQPRRQPSHLVPVPAEGGEQARVALTPKMAAHERTRIEAAAVQEMNERHAFGLLGNRAVVLVERQDGSLTLTSIEHLSQWLRNKPLRVPVEKRGEVEWKDIDRAYAWLKHPARRTVETVAFAPGIDLGSGAYNLWRGWPLAPKDDGGEGCKLIRAHVLTEWCRGDEQLARWVFAWFAQLVQQPCSKPGTAIVLRGKEGTGKGIIAAQLMGRILGRAHAHLIHGGQVTGRFNSVWQGRLLAFADEAVWAGDKSAEGTLKGMITESKVIIEPKGKDTYEIDNHARIIFASNERWVVPAGPDARRFCVLDVSDARMGDRAYFDALRAEVHDDGAASFLAWLLAYDLGDIDLRTPPVTGALLDQKLRSLDTVSAWWRERLWAGFIDDPKRILAREVDESRWPDRVPCAQLYTSYLAFCERRGHRYPDGEESFGSSLRELAPVRRVRSSPDALGKRPWLYEFGTDGVSTLHYLRGHFEKHLGGALTWPGDDEADRDAEGGDEAPPHPEAWMDKVPF